MMRRYKQFDSLVIDDFEVEEWQHPLHNHNHFEIVFIAKGGGIHHLNQVQFTFRQGDLFLLGPEDEHRFEVQQRSRFIYFKFTRLYITHQPDLPTPNQWNRDVDQLLYNPERKKGNLLRSATDRLLVQELMQIIVQEYRRKKVLSQKIIFQLFSVVMLIIKRNGKAYEMPEAQREKSGIAEDIMEYIELNIYEPKKLTLKNLANHFHYSSNYIGLLFKEKVGTTLRDYVSDYRFKLVEQRLKHSHIGMKQLASEFGFVDESHLHKFMKNKAGKSLSEIRA
uniref:AraC family transcriptional regulator n=1 Tax=Roseihalotalea indica TaxID=2867963 RepID=A0AA49JDC3_9BACT|nr:AraC family transcriptional regulator [Tunicatimonas sp. TK19036]